MAKRAASNDQATRTPDASSRRRILEPVVRRNQILRAAAEVFAEKGFHTARIADVAQRADVAQGTIYRFFQSKEELAQTLLRNGSNFLRAATEAAMDEAERRGDRSLAFEIFVHNATRFYERHRGELLALHSWSLDPSARPYVDGIDDEAVEAMASLVKLSGGRLRPMDRISIPRLVLLLLYSLSSQLEHYGASRAGAEVVEQLINQLVVAET